MSSLKLTYFDTTGRAEPIRLALAVGGIAFEDERLSGDQFGALKPKIPVGQVPVLTVDGVVYSQSAAILRYAGKLAGLYSRDDDLAAMRVDEVLDHIEDAVVKIYQNSSADGRKQFVDETLPKYLSALNKIAEENEKSPWLVGDSMTIADLKCYVFVTGLASGVLDHIPADVVSSKYTYVLKSTEAVREHPKVVEWENARSAKT